MTQEYLNLTVLEYCNEKCSLKMETHNNSTLSISQQTDTTKHNMCFSSSTAHLSISIYRLLSKAQKHIYLYICVRYTHRRHVARVWVYILQPV